LYSKWRDEKTKYKLEKERKQEREKKAAERETERLKNEKLLAEQKAQKILEEKKQKESATMREKELPKSTSPPPPPPSESSTQSSSSPTTYSKNFTESTDNTDSSGTNSKPEEKLQSFMKWVNTKSKVVSENARRASNSLTSNLRNTSTNLSAQVSAAYTNAQAQMILAREENAIRKSASYAASEKTTLATSSFVSPVLPSPSSLDPNNANAKSVNKSGTVTPPKAPLTKKESVTIPKKSSEPSPGPSTSSSAFSLATSDEPNDDLIGDSDDLDDLEHELENLEDL
jgi:hypothetical protein